MNPGVEGGCEPGGRAQGSSSGTTSSPAANQPTSHPASSSSSARPPALTKQQGLEPAREHIHHCLSAAGAAHARGARLAPCLQALCQLAQGGDNREPGQAVRGRRGVGGREGGREGGRVAATDSHAAHTPRLPRRLTPPALYSQLLPAAIAVRALGSHGRGSRLLMHPQGVAQAGAQQRGTLARRRCTPGPLAGVQRPHNAV